MSMTFANKITIFRILSVPFFIATLLYYTPEKEYLRFVALGIFILAIISDAIDGYIARTLRQKTKAGALLDPLADKFLLITAFVLLYVISNKYFPIKMPLWIMVVVISRDVILLLGGSIFILTNQNFEITPTWRGKLSTFFQMMTIACLLLRLSFCPLVWSVAMIFTVLSGFDYLRKGILILNSQPAKKI